MSMLADTVVETSDRLVQRIRAEFLEMPGLRLTASQAARVFGIDARQVKGLLNGLADQGWLVCDTRGVYRRPDAVGRIGTRVCRHEAPAASPGEPVTDLLDQLAVELPCLVCFGWYRIPLRKIRLSQLMMDTGCDVRHFADCPPAGLAHLIDPEVLAEFEAAFRRIEAEADGTGGRLVGPQR